MYIIGFDQRIKDLRYEKGLSQKELADRLHITRAAVNAWEMGTAMPSLERIIDIADFFRVSTDFLLGREKAEYVDVKGLKVQEKELIHRILYYMDYLKPEFDKERGNGTD